MVATTRLFATSRHVTNSLQASACDSYEPPQVWVNEIQANRFSAMNRPTAGAREERELPRGKNPVQLYSLGTPNGQKVTIFLEELCDLQPDFDYDAWLINIGAGDQFTSGFVAANPNSKIPAMLDCSNPEKPVRLFESGSMLLHLAEKYGHFVPKQPEGRSECINWLMWQMASAPLIGGGFGHFYAYAPDKLKYPIDRYTMEVKRLLDVADRHLADKNFFCGDDLTIADMAIYPWFYVLTRGGYKSGDVPCHIFLEAHLYKHVARWMDLMAARPAVKRGMRVNGKVRERHSREDMKEQE